MTAEPQSRGSDPKVGHYQPGFHTIRADHLPALEIGQIDGMSVVQQPRFSEGPQRVRTQPLVDQVVAMGTVEIQQQGGDALPGDLGDGNEQRAACHVGRLYAVVDATPSRIPDWAWWTVALLTSALNGCPFCTAGYSQQLTEDRHPSSPTGGTGCAGHAG